MMRHASLRLRSRCVASGTRDSNGRILITDSLIKQPTSFPRPHCCVRVLPLCFTHPVEGWAERRETLGCSAEHPWACT